LYSSPNIISVITSRRKGHISQMGDMGNVYRCWQENPKERDSLGDLGLDGRILKLILRIKVRERARDSFGSGSSRIMALGSTQPLPETSTRYLPGGKGRLARKAYNLTICLENVRPRPPVTRIKTPWP
jgi:hypothetical protein